MSSYILSLIEEPKTIKILEVCKVAPDAAPSKFSLPLTFLDKIWLQSDPASRLIFYEFPQQKYNSSVLLARLKKSLSRTLQHYLPLAGQLIWPQDSDIPVIHYQTGDGVFLTIAETQANFNTLSGNDFRDSNILHSLLPDFPASKTQSPPITLQVTLFPHSGFCISYVVNHAVLDGKSAAMFIHSWAYLCKFGDKAILPPEIAPYLDRVIVKQQQEEFERAYPDTMGKKVDPENRVFKTYDMSSPPDTMHGTFILTRENIDDLKKSVLAYWGKKNKLETTTRVTSYVVSSAYAIVCFIKAIKLTVERTYFNLMVNARARLDIPLPSNYFGNCVVWSVGFGYTDELLSQNGFFFAVEVITKAQSLLNEGLVKLAGKLKDVHSSLPEVVVRFVVASSPQFELYKADFGWGKPKKVDLVSIDRSFAIHLCDDRDGKGGIEIGVALRKHHAEAFTSAFASEINECKSLYSRL